LTTNPGGAVGVLFAGQPTTLGTFDADGVA
jgi:hypothetical protein